MSSARVALFVEGSDGVPHPRLPDPLHNIWNSHLVAAARLRPFSIVVPISKKHIIAMDPLTPPMSGAGEPLDKMMARIQARSPFDAAVVAWDLVPKWDPRGQTCRGNEVRRFYECLAASNALPERWRNQAKRRLASVEAGVGALAFKLKHGTTVAMCMEPMFEALLTEDRWAILAAVGLSAAPPGWPASGWGRGGTLRPDVEVLGAAIQALRKLRPPHAAVRRVRGDIHTNKDGWAEFLLRQLLASQAHRGLILGHPIVQRLAARAR